MEARIEERALIAADTSERWARRLGWLSVGLGLTGLISPRAVSRFALGRHDRHKHRAMMAIGARELVCGLGLLTRRRPTGWLWARVAGDAIDLGLLGRALALRHARKEHVIRSLAAVAGVALLDLAASIRLSLAEREATRQARTLRVSRAITVNRPADEVYRFWRNLTNLPRFMAHLEHVEIVSERRSRWTARGPRGKRLSWDAEIVEERPEEIIRWRSLEGARVSNQGSVQFQRAPGGRGCEIQVALEYQPPGGPLGLNLAKLFGKFPEQQLESDLRRLKQLIETGEVMHSDASIHRGRHPAQPPARLPFNGGKGVVR